ncbi:WD repeat- and FYVE domain-containing protein 4 [Protopterus annectens]|uniref:WD repeat- and FYVE domain-containing protein 4 n=1 Tax=Protopterus annectens TaxID=7888 RepID=UPI001CFAC349|nr:WD repeat- and FYVE domain-containing protein 4 [Protopterus annectens]
MKAKVQLTTYLTRLLLKCLYHFSAFPAGGKDISQGNNVVTFQEVFTQLVCNLCSCKNRVEELLQTNELQCLITAMASHWDQMRPAWRVHTACVLRTISAIQTKNTVMHLEAIKCVRMGINSLSTKVEQFRVWELAEVAVCIFSFVTESYPISPALLIQFENNNGYQLLMELLLLCDKDQDEDHMKPINDLVDLLARFTVCGHSELKVAFSATNPQLADFQFEQPSRSGNTVKNIQSFKVLQSVFEKINTTFVNMKILSALETIWTWDRTNFFLLEFTLQPLCHFAELICSKSPPVQMKYFKLLEYVVYQLSYIPHEALKKTQSLIKENKSSTCTLAALECFHNLTVHDSLFSEIFRDSGLLGMLLAQLRNQAKILRKSGSLSACESDCDRALTGMMLKTVSALLQESVRNTVILKDYGMVPYIKIFLDDQRYRISTLCILEQLAIVNTEEYMSIVIGALCSSTQGEMQLRLDLLQSLLFILESPKGCAAFRTAGGFDGLLSILADMEGALSYPPTDIWASVEEDAILNLILFILCIITAAMHMDPVNMHYFKSNHHFEKMKDYISLLGCFNKQGQIKSTEGLSEPRTFEVLSNIASKSFEQFPKCLRSCLKILNFLDQIAQGTFHSQSYSEVARQTHGSDEQTVDRKNSLPDGYCGSVFLEPMDKMATGHHSLLAIEGRTMADIVIAHPGAVCVIVSLLPNLVDEQNLGLSKELQCAVINHIQSFVKNEKNRQIMCEAGLLNALITHCHDLLTNKDDPLYLGVTRIFEKLASQAIDPIILRHFLRLGSPLNCAFGEEGLPLAYCERHPDLQGQNTKAEVKNPQPILRLLHAPKGSAVASQRIVSLVTMTSPRSFHQNQISITPSFVEFDMSANGYGCLFFPTLATVTGGNVEPVVTGGHGGGCRGFPSATGLTFSTWFLVNKCISCAESHPIYFLTVIRHMSRVEQDFVCLSISYSARDQTLIISTEEEVFQSLEMMEPETIIPSPEPARIQFKSPKLMGTGQWKHLVVTLTKEVKKRCTATAYLNGQIIGSVKMQYIQPFPGTILSLDPSAMVDVYGFIGTPPVWKESSSLCWQLGPTYMFEEAVTSETVGIICRLGPNYLSNFQAVSSEGVDFSGESMTCSLVSEEKIMFGINPVTSSVTTITDIKTFYNEVDSRQIAKEMGVASRDNIMPVFLTRNTAAHLSGPARTLGAVALGHLGVRVFRSNPAARSLNFIGGPDVLLGLVAMAADDHAIYAAIKVFLCILNSSPASQNLMKHNSGYKLLAFLLKKKIRLLNNRIFQLIISITGTVDLGFGSTVIQNRDAFRDLLCDFEIWLNAPEKLDLALFSHLEDLFKPPSDGTKNAEIAHQLQLVPKLIFLLSDPSMTGSKVISICNILTHLLKGHFNTQDFLRIGLFVVYTLTPDFLDEKNISLNQISDISVGAVSHVSGKTVWLRNKLLEVLIEAVCSDTLPFCSQKEEEVFSALGLDWFLLLIQSHIHQSTVVLATKLLLYFLHNPILLGKFQDRLEVGIWIKKSVDDLNLLMDNLICRSQILEYSSCFVLGFQVLQEFLCHHVDIPDVYLYLAALLMQKSACTIPDESKDLDSMLQWLLEIPGNEFTQKLGLCTSAALVLLEMLKCIINKPTTSEEHSWQMTYPGSVMQFFCLLYHSFPADPMWYQSEFLHTLASTVFPAASSVTSCASLSVDSPVVAEGSNDEFAVSQLLHPARKQVYDFIRILLMDSLSRFSVQKQQHPLDIILEASPDSATNDQKKIFQSKILLSVMDILHILNQDGSESERMRRDGTNDPADGNQTSFWNVAYFSQKLVEKFYTGMLECEPTRVLLFITDQIVMVTENVHCQRDQIMVSLYSSLNRAVLFSLSRSRQSIGDVICLLDTLKILQEQWDIIFATYNSNMSFIVCFIHCLLQIRSGSYPDGFGLEATSKMVKWHHDFQGIIGKREQVVLPKASDVKQDILKAVESVWNQLMAQRRQSLEDTYKICLSVKQGTRESQVNINEVTPLWEEAAAKAWQQHLATEKKNLSNRGAAALLQAPQSPKPRSSSLTAAVTSIKKKFTRGVECKIQDLTVLMDTYRETGQEIFSYLYKEHLQMLQCSFNKTAQQWTKVEVQLLRERGLWGPTSRTVYGKWVLDPCEGPSRMRRKMKHTYACNTVPDEGTQIDQNQLAGVQVQLKQNQHGNILNENQIVTEGTEMIQSPLESVPGEDKGDGCRLTFFPALRDGIPSEDFFEKCTERQVILQELAETEKISLKCSIVVVCGHIILEGVLFFGHEHFYICENYILSATGDVYCTDHRPSSIQDSFICSIVCRDTSADRHKCFRLSYSHIKEAHLMRFLLQDIALELFLKDGYSKFLVFPHRDRSKAFKKFCTAVPALKGKGITEASINLRKNPGGDKSVLQKWQKGEISNFDYLVFLNTQAGRTYSDLMQYPVFPWILSDYTSEYLDFNNPKTFRDLSKPMGAQTKDRRAKFIQRYHEVENNDGPLSAQCHYCTHYSSAIIVASYLVRMEPFNQTFCSLQGGTFDVADRMFHSVKHAWHSASRDNMSDVRELIPEFFYLPDFLVNLNNFEFGCMQDGTTLDDVELPPWAKGDPQEFIRIHRQALESDYVSANLHHWIDLIFGYKQLGTAAVEAINVFHPYFYREQADLSNNDPMIRNTILGFVSNFGQIPKQIFTKPHPAKIIPGKSTSGKEAASSASSTGSSQPFFYNIQSLKPSAIPIKELHKGAVGHIVCTEKGMLAVEQNKVLIPPKWNKTFSWGFDDLTCCIGNYGSDKNIAVFESLAEWGACLCAACPTSTTIITSGASTVVCVWEISVFSDRRKGISLKQALYGHKEAVTCLAASATYGVIVSGSLDRTCIVWDLNQLIYITQLPGHETGLSCVALNDLTGDIVSCAGAHLYIWTVNGQAIANINTACGPDEYILCCCFSELNEWDSHSVIIAGSTDGIVRLWKLEYSDTTTNEDETSPLRCVSSKVHKKGNKWEKHLVLCRELNRIAVQTGKRNRNGPAVTALAVSRNHSKLLVGDASGRIYSWSVEG